MPLNDDDEDLGQPRFGIKPNIGKKSIIDQASEKKVQEQNNFENKVAGHENHFSEKAEKSKKLATRFVDLVLDKTLHLNKDVIKNDFEKDVLIDLIRFAEELNNSEFEKESQGSMFIISLLLKNSLRNRDKINMLEYEISQLKNKIESK